MILALASIVLGLQAPPSPPTRAERDEEVLVLGRKLKEVRVRTDWKTGQCRVTRSTGDHDIDAVWCASFERCWPGSRFYVERATVRGLASWEREALLTQAKNVASRCVFPVQKQLMQHLAERRYEDSRR